MAHLSESQMWQGFAQMCSFQTKTKSCAQAHQTLVRNLICHSSGIFDCLHREVEVVQNLGKARRVAQLIGMAGLHCPKSHFVVDKELR